MDTDIEQLKKKIIYRSNYRGTKEMDKLLGSFTNEYINQLNLKDLRDLEKLLDHEDEDLYNYFKDLSTNVEFEKNNVNMLFKNFKYIVK
jgi:antitoxin CptB